MHFLGFTWGVRMIERLPSATLNIHFISSAAHIWCVHVHVHAKWRKEINLHVTKMKGSTSLSKTLASKVLDAIYLKSAQEMAEYFWRAKKVCACGSGGWLRGENSDWLDVLRREVYASKVANYCWTLLDALVAAETEFLGEENNLLLDGVSVFFHFHLFSFFRFGSHAVLTYPLHFP